MDTKAALEEQQAQLLRSIDFYRGDLHAAEKNADPMDQTTAEANREESGREISRQLLNLHEVEEALQRIADGTYGTCIDCEEEISGKRLAARPAAARCIACQERHDRRIAAENARQASRLPIWVTRPKRFNGTGQRVRDSFHDRF